MKIIKLNKWLNWSILAICFFMAFFYRFSIGAIAPILSSTLKLTSSQISTLTYLTYYSYALMQIPAGILVDVLGPRKTSSIGMLLTTIASFLFSFGNSILLLNISRILTGVGTSVILLSTLKIQANWFSEDEFSKASSLNSFIGNLGSLCTTMPLVFLSKYLGLKVTFLLMGIVSLCLFILILTCLRDYPQKAHTFVKVIKFNLMEGLISVLKNKFTLLNAFFIFNFLGIITSLMGLLGMEFLGKSYEISVSQSAFYLSFLPYGFIVGSLLMGKVVNHTKEKYMILPIIGSVSVFLIWIYIILISHGKPPLYLMCPIFFILGIATLTHIVVFTNAKEMNNLKFAGIAMSVVNSFEFIGSGITSYIITTILTSTGSITKSFSVYIFMAIISIFISVLLYILTKKSYIVAEN